MKKLYISALCSALVMCLFAFNVATAQAATDQNGTAKKPEPQQEEKASPKAEKPPQTTGEYIDDSAITAAVKADILKEKGLSSMSISVKTKDGIVTLSGKVDSVEHVALAERVAKQANSVKKVVNELQVEGKTSQSAGEYIDDSAITTAVKGNILKEKGLSSLDISVTTLEGIVTLSGTADTVEHAQLAERVAKQVNNVKRVVNDLKIK